MATDCSHPAPAPIERDIGGFDLRSLPADFYENPFPYYTALRAASPVRRLPDGSYLLTRYDDVEFVYKNPKIFSSDKKQEFGDKFGASPLFEHHTTSLVFNDPPLHTRVRRLINGALTPRAIGQIQPDLERLVDRLIEADGGEGIGGSHRGFRRRHPGRGDRQPVGRTARRALAAARLVSGHTGRAGTALDVGGRKSAAIAAVEEFSAYLDGLIERRRMQAGPPDADLISRLLYGEFEGQSLNRAELVQNCIFLLNAGHETTTNLIGNGLVALAEHRDQRDRLLADPRLIKTAVEEFLRYESPNQLGNRISAQPVTLGGVAMPAGTQITLCIGAANRDPDEFREPDTLDIGRSPNRHLAFGSGIHQCAGVGVARLEAATAIGRFVQRFPSYTLASPPTRGGRARFRGFLRVPVRTGR